MKARYQDLFDKEINEYYKVYKKFIGISYLPDFEIKKFDGYRYRTAKKASINIIDFEKQIYELKIDKTLPLVYKNGGYKPFLFHEFTHIWDGYQEFQFFKKTGKKYNDKFFTEFHAIKIQMMNALGFLSLTDEKRILLSNTVMLGSEPKSLKDYLIYATDDYLATVTSGLKTKEEVFDLLIQIIYYFGLCSFCEDYCLDNYSQYVTTNFFQNVFGNEIEDLFYQCKMTKNAIDDLIPQICDTCEKCYINAKENGY